MKLIELDRKARDIQKRYKGLQIMNKASYIKPKVSFYNNAEEVKLYKKYLFYKGIKKAFRKVDD